MVYYYYLQMDFAKHCLSILKSMQKLVQSYSAQHAPLNPTHRQHACACNTFDEVRKYSIIQSALVRIANTLQVNVFLCLVFDLSIFFK